MNTSNYATLQLELNEIFQILLHHVVPNWLIMISIDERKELFDSIFTHTNAYNTLQSFTTYLSNKGNDVLFMHLEIFQKFFEEKRLLEIFAELSDKSPASKTKYQTFIQLITSFPDRLLNRLQTVLPQFWNTKYPLYSLIIY